MTRQSSPTHLYELDITVPAGSTEPGWSPPGWKPHRPGEVFRWPGRRRFVDPINAHRHKRRLQNWGAKVVVRVSLPVQWPGTPTLALPAGPVEAMRERFATEACADTVRELGTRMQCSEVDALAALLRALGEDEAADMWIREHSTAPDCDTDHTP